MSLAYAARRCRSLHQRGPFLRPQPGTPASRRCPLGLHTAYRPLARPFHVRDPSRLLLQSFRLTMLDVVRSGGRSTAGAKACPCVSRLFFRVAAVCHPEPGSVPRCSATTVRFVIVELPRHDSAPAARPEIPAHLCSTHCLQRQREARILSSRLDVRASYGQRLRCRIFRQRLRLPACQCTWCRELREPAVVAVGRRG